MFNGIVDMVSNIFTKEKKETNENVYRELIVDNREEDCCTCPIVYKEKDHLRLCKKNQLDPLSENYTTLQNEQCDECWKVAKFYV